MCPFVILTLTVSVRVYPWACRDRGPGGQHVDDHPTVRADVVVPPGRDRPLPEVSLVGEH